MKKAISFKNVRTKHGSVYEGNFERGVGEDVNENLVRAPDVRIRIGCFPEEPLYIASLGDQPGEEYEINLPAIWSLRPPQPLFK
jgi:hypothetical protein